MKFKLLCILCLSFALISNVEGKDPDKKKELTPVDVTVQTLLMNEQVSRLMADRISRNIGITLEELASIDDYINEEDLLELESIMFPADEIYGSWDTTWVNPYRNQAITYPDSFSIDCTTFNLPLDVTLKITSEFGVRGRRLHNGIDLKLQTGDTVRTAFSGKVRIKSYERRGYGYYLVIRHQNGLETVYGHLSKFLVGDNEIVKAGQAIGLGGNTGRSTGSHLHFETRFLGQALNPHHIIDFKNGGAPFNDYYVIYNKNFGKNTNIYTSASERIVYHRIQKGETLSKIAVMYRTSVSELCRLNGLTTKSILREGQSIRCGTTIDTSAKKQIAEAPVKKENVEASAKKEDVVSTPSSTTQATASVPISDTNTSSTSTLAADNTSNNPTPRNTEVETPTDIVNYHLVKSGETLFSISKQYKTTIGEICRLNGITEKDILSIGQKIRYTGALPSTSTATTAIPVQNAVTQPVFYQIKEGDTLSEIAQKHGVSINKLCELNNISRTTILRVGRSLRCS